MFCDKEATQEPERQPPQSMPFLPERHHPVCSRQQEFLVRGQLFVGEELPEHEQCSRRDPEQGGVIE